MLRFRPPSPRLLFTGQPVTPAGARRVVADLLRPAHFLVAPPLCLEWRPAGVEEVSWEIFRGRLLDPAHTRERAVFEAWNVFARAPAPSDEPILSVKLHTDSGRLHVVRGLECHVWEGYADPGAGNVYLSRERCRWIRELVGTIDLARPADLEELRDELSGLLFHAVVGVSRLPLTSLEAPLPAFSFGQLLYCPAEPDDLPSSCGETTPVSRDRLLEGMLPRAVTPSERAKVLEVFLRGATRDELRAALAALERLGMAEVLALLRTLYNEVSLSPWTLLVERTLDLLRLLRQRGLIAAAEHADFLGWVLRQQGRHLTAYDLVTFHHRGANYPDALLLDLVLKELLALLEDEPGLGLDGEARRLRRGLRQGWLLRRRLEGHPVPDQPTSPGENMRVLPGEHARVPEEQIQNVARRRRLLFEGDPLPGHLGPRGREVLRQALRDLEHPDELAELGTALYLDRPLGMGKAPGEPDQTPLLSALAWSRNIALQRLSYLADDPALADEADFLTGLRPRLEALEMRGLPVSAVGGAMRPGVVSLVDARLASADFLLLRSTAASVRALLALFDFAPLCDSHPEAGRLLARPVLLALAPGGDAFLAYDEQYQPRIELRVPAETGYQVRACVEYPAGGLHARVVGEGGREVVLPPRT